MDAVVKRLAEVDVNVFNKNLNALIYVPALHDALTNSKGAVIQIRKPVKSDCINLNTNFYFVFCFLIVNRTFNDRSIENV